MYVDFPGVGALPESAVAVKNTDTSVELSITAADGKAVHVLKLAPLYDKVNSESWLPVWCRPVHGYSDIAG